MPDFDDPRLTPPPGEGAPFQVSAGVVAVRAAPAPDAEMVTQALHGETVWVFKERGDYAHVQLDRDRYVGWALMEALSAPVLPVTLRVKALRTYVFSEPDLKSAPRFLISLNAGVVAGRKEGRFVECARAGWVFEEHLAGLDEFETDPAAVALRFLGAPYLWGGRESLGLDCTGLAAAAYGACGVLFPRDSDMQCAWNGVPVEDWDAPGALQRGDQVFWKGHCGIMLDAETLIHANAYHMAVAVEPFRGAVERIEVHYGRPTAARRIEVDAVRGIVPDWMKAL